MSKALIGILVFLLVLTVSGTISYASYDYFYNLKMDECQAIMSSDYQVSTESVTMCHKIGVNKFWNYDIGYWIGPFMISIVVAFFTMLIIDINEMYGDFGRL